MTLSSIQTINIERLCKFMGWAPEEHKNPYASIEQAMMIVEKMCTWANDDRMIIIKGMGIGDDPDGEEHAWASVEITGDCDTVKIESVYGRTFAQAAAEAICKAAIQALDGQGKE